MQLTRDSDSDGAGGGTSVVTADRFILCHSVLETMDTWGGGISNQPICDLDMARISNYVSDSRWI